MISSISKQTKMIIIEEALSNGVHYITESDIAFLVEGKLELLKNQNPNISTEHEHSSDIKTGAADIIDHLASADPTQNKAHTPYLVSLYKQGKIRQEDTPRIQDTLENFEAHKKFLTPEQKQVNIKRYPSLSDVSDAVIPHMGKQTAKGERKAASDTRKEMLDNLDIKGKHELVLNHPQADIYNLKDKDTSTRLYGKGYENKSESHPFATSWCTAGSGRNYFDSYKKDGAGAGELPNSFFVIHRKSDGEVFQMHPASGQFMDRKDNSISYDDYNSISGAVKAAHDQDLFGLKKYQKS